MEVIECEPKKVIPLNKRMKRAALWWCGQTFALLGCAAAGDAWLLNGRLTSALDRALTAPASSTEIELPKNESVRDVAIRVLEKEFGVPRPVWAVILRKESDGNPYATKFEPSQMSKARKFTSNPYEQKYLATSYGVWQVMGWWTYEMDRVYGEKTNLKDLMFDLEANTRMAARIMAHCYHRGDVQAGDTVRERLYLFFKCYNGSDEYARDAMSRLKDEMIRNFDVDIRPVKDELGEAISHMDMSPKPRKRGTRVASLPPEVGEPFIAEARE